MVNRLLLALIVLLAGAVMGLGLGLYVGWSAWPATYINTELPSLRQDYQDDYVVMVATAYGWEGDLERARARLRLLGDEPAARVAGVITRLQAAGTSPADLQRLNRLLVDLRTAAPAPGASPAATQSP